MAGVQRGAGGTAWNGDKSVGVIPVLERPKARPLWEVHGGRLTLHLHPGQTRAWDSEKRFTFIISGSQSGKTSFGPFWLEREIRHCGPGDYLAVTSTYPLLKLKMLPDFLELFDRTLHLGEWKAGDATFIFRDGKTRVIFGSAVNSESLEAATAKAAWLDEVGQDMFRLESWEAVQRRLSIHQGRVLGTTTPYNSGWMKQQIYDPWTRGNSDIEVVQFPSIMNPVFPLEEMERMEGALPAWKFNMFYRGEFDRPAGLIYSDFIDLYREEGGHKVRSFKLPAAWPRHVGLDFGAVNTAMIWLAHDTAADIFYAYRCTLGGGKTTGQHVAEALMAAAGLNVLTWDGGSPSETQQRMDWQAAGVPVRDPPFADVEAGLDRVIALFKSFRLFVFDDLVGLLDELGTYSRVVGEDGLATEKIKDKESFHRLDALRSVAIGITQPGPGLWWLEG